MMYLPSVGFSGVTAMVYGAAAALASAMLYVLSMREFAKDRVMLAGLAIATISSVLIGGVLGRRTLDSTKQQGYFGAIGTSIAVTLLSTLCGVTVLVSGYFLSAPFIAGSELARHTGVAEAIKAFFPLLGFGMAAAAPVVLPTGVVAGTICFMLRSRRSAFILPKMLNIRASICLGMAATVCAAIIYLVLQSPMTRYAFVGSLAAAVLAATALGSCISPGMRYSLIARAGHGILVSLASFLVGIFVTWLLDGADSLFSIYTYAYFGLVFTGPCVLPCGAIGGVAYEIWERAHTRSHHETH